jgi:hypothetical protein
VGESPHPIPVEVIKMKSPISLYILLALLIACAVAAFFSGSLEAAGLFNDPSVLLTKLIWPLTRATLFISIGLFVGLIIEGMGWTNRLAVIARPFMRWGHLSDQMGAAFTTAFASGTASLSMLMSFHQEGSMSRREVTFSILLNTFPSYFLHLPRTFFILLALVGKAGVIYITLTFCAALLRFVTVLLCAHFILPESQSHNDAEESKKREWKELLRETSKKLKPQLARILRIVLPVYLIVMLISDMGFFLWLRESLAHVISSAFIPIDAMSIVIFSLMAEFTSGYAAAGAMLEAGSLNVFQTVLALVLGYIIASPVRALRHQMPYYIGIFGPALGIRLMIFSQAFRVASMIIIGLIFVLWMV